MVHLIRKWLFNPFPFALFVMVAGCQTCIPDETNTFFLTGKVASACTAESPCDGDLTCYGLTEQGYCTAGCPQAESCPFGSTCTEITALQKHYCKTPTMQYKTSGAVGASCQDKGGCDPCLECLEVGSEKRCSKSCNPGSPCPMGSHCGSDAFKGCSPDTEGATGPDTIGKSCDTKADCESAQECVSFGSDHICTVACSDSCPNGFSCKTGAVDTQCVPDGDESFYFQGPDIGRLCNTLSPCADGLECVQFGQQSYCTRSCVANTRCPSGSQCNDLPESYTAPATPPATSQSGASPLCLQTSGEIGAKCANENECALGLKCVNQIPGGFCTRECSAEDPCPKEYNTKCIRLSGGFGTVCLKPCATACDCGEGTTCTRVGKSTSFVCFPNF